MRAPIFAGLALVACAAVFRSGGGPSLALERLPSTPDSLFLHANWSPSTVANPTGPITYQVTWSKGASTVIRIDTTAGREQTLRMKRAGVGTSDTVGVCIRPIYLGSLYAGRCATGVYANPDTQVPTVPDVTIDTLALVVDGFEVYAVDGGRWGTDATTSYRLWRSAPGATAQVQMCAVIRFGDGRKAVRLIDLPLCGVVASGIPPALRATAAQQAVANQMALRDPGPTVVGL